MKNLLTTIVIFISLNVLSQPLKLYDDKYNFDSIAKININKILIPKTSDGIVVIKPYDRFKVTLSTKLNSSVIINANGLSELTITDYFNFGAYDIRARFYITPNFKVFQRVFITGINKNNYLFSTGVMLKF
jgi:hypothetical protein